MCLSSTSGPLPEAWEFEGLHIGSLRLLLCPAHYAGRVSEDRWGVCVDGLDLVLPIELTFQDLSHSLVVLWCCCPPCLLIMVPMRLWDIKVLVAGLCKYIYIYLYLFLYLYIYISIYIYIYIYMCVCMKETGARTQWAQRSALPLRAPAGSLPHTLIRALMTVSQVGKD